MAAWFTQSSKGVNVLISPSRMCVTPSLDMTKCSDSPDPLRAASGGTTSSEYGVNTRRLGCSFRTQCTNLTGARSPCSRKNCATSSLVVSEL